MDNNKVSMKTIVYPVLIDMDNPLPEIFAGFVAIINYYKPKYGLTKIGDALSCAEIMLAGMIDDVIEEGETADE